MGDRVWLETATPPVLGKEIRLRSVFLQFALIPPFRHGDGKEVMRKRD